MKQLIVECPNGACQVGELLESYTPETKEVPGYGTIYTPSEKVRVTDPEVVQALGKLAPWGHEYDQFLDGYLPYFEAGGVVVYLWSGTPDPSNVCIISYK